MPLYPSTTLRPGPGTVPGTPGATSSGPLYPSTSLYPSAGLRPGVGAGGPTTGVRVFLGPTEQIHFRLEGNLFGSYDRGLSVWLLDGQWFTGYTPTAEIAEAADRFYGGGRIHTLTPDREAELRAAGFGRYITTQEAP